MPAKKSGPTVIGKVVHYFDKIQVAVIRVDKGKLSVGDTVTFQRGDEEVTEVIESMEVDHQPVKSISKGQEAGVKVSAPLKEGYLVVRGG